MAAEVRSDEITSILRKQLESIDTSADTFETGTVLQVGDGIARIYGLANAMAGELVEITGAKKNRFRRSAQSRK